MLARWHWALLLSSSSSLFGQSAQLSGLILDPAGLSVANVSLELRNRDTGVRRQTVTNPDGFYSFPSLTPGTYQAALQAQNFRTVTREAIRLDVGDRASLDFHLQLVSGQEQVTVTSDKPPINPLDPAVSTVVDQQFVENMPLNGRSFQSLIALTPGVVFTAREIGIGQFGVNGHRSNANYFMVDGVSANLTWSNLGTLGQTVGGASAAFTSDGGTNGLVSADAMEEFRIQTSTYAAEFGRTPGGLISILTKSGTNQFHGTAFDYFRNDALDARNFFNMRPAPKPPLRQNDYGGTLSGPVMRNRTFFFLSYEGLRLRLPRTQSNLFYTESARAAVAPAYQPFINALPLPTEKAIDPNCDNVTIPCLAPLTVVYSYPSSLDATSIRVDHNVSEKVALFGRYNHSPSQSATRLFSSIQSQSANIDTLTTGATILISDAMVNEFRGNWSRVAATRKTSLTDSYGVKVPSDSVLFPASYNPATTQALVFFGVGFAEVRIGPLAENLQRQLNFVNTLSWSSGTHQAKIGIDHRIVNSASERHAAWSVFPRSYASLVAGTADSVLISAREPLSIRLHNISVFGQDTWRSTDRLTLTYGLRWELNTAPVSATPGRALYAVRGIFDTDPVSLAPGSLWRTRYSDFAPRFGAAFRATSRIVVRGGLGVFYDLGYGNVGGTSASFPYHRSKSTNDLTLPFNPSAAAFQIPPFSTTLDANGLIVSAVDPKLALPYTLQWNTALELALGVNQALTASYVGAHGRRLLLESIIRRLEPAGVGSDRTITATNNGGSSQYNALQVQLRRRMSRGLQALISYTLAESSDTGSSDIFNRSLTASSVSQIVPPPLTPSDFDIRHSLSGAFSYEMPWLAGGTVHSALMKGWALDGLVRVSSAPPINVVAQIVSPIIGLYNTQADSVPGQPYWIEDLSQPGGKALNRSAFAAPAAGTIGSFPRNGLRSLYSITQLDLALRRRFNLTERLQLDLRVEYFNVFNHPMFGAPGSMSAFPTNVTNPNNTFGKVAPGYTMNVALGSQNPLYSVGGPRSGQFTLKLHF